MISEIHNNTTKPLANCRALNMLLNSLGDLFGVNQEMHRVPNKRNLNNDFHDKSGFFKSYSCCIGGMCIRAHIDFHTRSDSTACLNRLQVWLR